METKPQEGLRYGTVRATNVVQDEVKDGPRPLTDTLRPIYPSPTERRGFLDRCCGRVTADGFRIVCSSLPCGDEDSLADVVDALAEAHA